MGRNFVNKIRETAGDGWPWMTRSQWQDMLRWLEWLKKNQTSVCAFNQMMDNPGWEGLVALAALGDAINILTVLGKAMETVPGAFIGEPPVPKDG